MKAPKLRRVEGGWRTRIRCGSAGQRYFTIALDNEAAAEKRATALADMGRRLVAAGKHLEATILLRKGAEQATEAGFRDVETLVRDLSKDAPRAKTALVASPLTFRQLGEQWTSGQLARRHPDHVKVKKSSDHDEQRLAVLNETIGDVLIRDFTLADAERAMAALPSSAKTSATRRQYGQVLSRVLGMAVWPLKLRESSPLPKGFLPKIGARPAFTFLYPAEDARLLACPDISLPLRALYGFLAREGCRMSEALGLTWRDFDLSHGVVSLDENKTEVPRTWALSPGVAAALTALKGDASDDARVFPRVVGPAAEGLREHLKLAGVTRAELFVASERRLPLRAHDLRASFITIGLANGRTEAAITDRTGHTSSQMLYRYKRLSRRASELKLGEWIPLDRALPELCPPEQESRRADETVSHRVSHETIGDARPVANSPIVSVSSGAEIRTPIQGFKVSPPDATSVRSGVKDAAACTPGGTGAHDDSLNTSSGESPIDPVEQALAEGLKGAAAAGEWTVVASLARELEARRQARTAPEVVDFAKARARRGAP